MTRTERFKRTSVIFGSLLSFAFCLLFLSSPRYSNSSLHWTILEKVGLRKTEVQFDLEICQCKRTLNLQTEVKPNQDSFGNEIPMNKTSCGLDAFRRGGGQKVIAFSLFKDKDQPHSKAEAFVKGTVY